MMGANPIKFCISESRAAGLTWINADPPGIWNGRIADPQRGVIMRAFVLKRYGGPRATEFADVAKPEPGPRAVLIRVHAAGLNPVDYKTRRGLLRPIYRYRFPVVMGMDVAGTVGHRGPGAEGFSEGEGVFARLPGETMGAFAEYVAVSEDLVATMPRSTDFVSAAAVPLAGLTALQCLRDELRLKPGHRTFISAGVGGVGCFAVQLAKWLGAEVSTTASPSGLPLARSLGADQVIDYTRQSFADVLHNLDNALDLVGGNTLRRCFAVVRRGGAIVSTAGPPEPQTALKDLGRGLLLAQLFWLASLPIEMKALSHGVRYRYVFSHPSGSELAELANLIDTGVIKVVLDRVFPFAEVGEALAHLETGHAKGKVVVRMIDG